MHKILTQFLCFFRWLWVDNYNLSVLLVEAGLASVHNTADKTEFFSQLKRAEEQAKAKKEKVIELNFKLQINEIAFVVKLTKS